MHIGLFDSGVGGLTVLKQIKAKLPQAQLSYLGDTARLPYGNKAPETLLKYTQENMEFLDGLGVDVIVVACHSASSVVLKMTSSQKETPIYNVITPSCQEALKLSQSKKIGVISTKATAKSEVYSKQIKALDPKAQVSLQACPLLVPLVEEGYIEDEITEQVLNRYLTPLINESIDCLILGCTHYPILKNQIAQICGKNIQLVDPADSVAQALTQLPTSKPVVKPQVKIYLTDHASHFLEHAQSLLGQEALEVLTP